MLNGPVGKTLKTWNIKRRKSLLAHDFGDETCNKTAKIKRKG
jgi:hypothetical protein